MSKNGCLIISLDYELMWGMIDVAKKQGYGITNVAKVPEVIDKLLCLFDRYGVHATFAIVGLIMYKNVDSLLADMPSIYPSYHNKKLSPYENEYIKEITRTEERLFFQPDVVDKLNHSDGIEICTHTYSHFYCLEEGQTAQQFEQDIAKAIQIARDRGITIRSIVFPRNEVSEEYLQICNKYGIDSYRGNAIKFYNTTNTKISAIKNRICRFVDSYLCLDEQTTYIPSLDIDGMINIRASRFLRPCSDKYRFLEKLRLRRIRREMISAAISGKVYHLWWHPHNMGVNMDINLNFLEKILQCYKDCSNKYGMQSMTMAELSDKIRRYDK